MVRIMVRIILVNGPETFLPLFFENPFLHLCIVCGKKKNKITLKGKFSSTHGFRIRLLRGFCLAFALIPCEFAPKISSKKTEIGRATSNFSLFFYSGILYGNFIGHYKSKQATC